MLCAACVAIKNVKCSAQCSPPDGPPGRNHIPRASHQARPDLANTWPSGPHRS